MVAFPNFDKLDVDGYRLYPGVPSFPGLHLDFSPGPWIILGANGLGKSTLLLLLKHVVIGSVRLRGVGFTGDRSDLVTIDHRLFAVRVGDAAQEAIATAEVRFGAFVLRIRRRLRDLGLVEAVIRGAPPEATITDEETYRTRLASLMGLTRFEDAVRVLERVTFFLESREPLVWDLSAQFELFRALLTPSISEKMRSLEALIVSSDSSARNLNAALHKIASRIETNRVKLKNQAAVRAKLAQSLAELEKAELEEIEMRAQLDVADERRSDARIEFKRSDRAADEEVSKYEEVKFDALRHAFAGLSPNDQYVFLKLISERICPACGNHAEAAATLLEVRQSEGKCLVCGSNRQKDKIVATSEALHGKAAKAFQSLQKARATLEKARVNYRAATENHEKLGSSLENVRRKVDAVRREIRRLRSKLPSEDQATASRDEDRIENLRREVLNFRRERDEAEEQISGLLLQLKSATESIRERLELEFQRYARDFFSESIRLVYAPRRDRIGQGGRFFDFPAFEIELTSTATEGGYIRRTAGQVSLSQREYIDLIFRIGLMQVVGSSKGSFIVDGPEGSVDAIFAEKAGNLFASLSEKGADVTVILACNVVEGAFIPNTLRAYKSSSARSARTVNLLDLAAPTAALVQLRDEYRQAISKILSEKAR